MVRMARVDRRRRKDWPSASDNSEVTWRLGRNRRRVLLLAWLTLLPLNTPFPVISQRRDILELPSGQKKRAYGGGPAFRQGRTGTEPPSGKKLNLRADKKRPGVPENAGSKCGPG